MEDKTIKIGDRFEVVMPEQGATGLQLNHDELPAGIVLVERIATTGADKSGIGSAVNAVFRIEARSAGDCTVTFFNTQPWIPNGPRYTHRELRIRVLPE